MTDREALLPDEVWAQIPRTTADRRVVAAVLLALVLLIPAAIVGRATGMVLPRFSYEGGQSSVNAPARTIRFAMLITNDSVHSWRVIGATVHIPGAAPQIRISPVTLAAHRRRTVSGVIRIDDCAATSASLLGDQTAAPVVDIGLRVQRLIGTTTVTIHDVIAPDEFTLACAS